MLLPVAVLTALDWEERAVVAVLGGRSALCDGAPALVVRCGVGFRAALETARGLPEVRYRGKACPTHTAEDRTIEVVPTGRGILVLHLRPTERWPSESERASNRCPCGECVPGEIYS